MGTLEPLFALRDVGVTLDGREVLSGISLEIAHGSATCIVGRSGAGKTTLLRVFNRLNECFPGCTTTGDIVLRLDGRVVRPYADEIPLPELRRRVGMVFQHPNVLPMSIENNIVMPLVSVHGVPRRDARHAARLALEEVRLWREVSDRLDTDARTLSGGQQQRLCLARALAMQPSVLLLDEPTASLDSKAAQGIEDLLAGLKGRYTLVVVSHGLEFAARLADGMLVLRDGRIHGRLGPEALGGSGLSLCELAELL
ncbi:MAG: phosphate ABC transporter ATP-binding protein [Deltaproteobacteria bacterium]|nr:phosphate ABC transporter ATP-binding protein [Deltaproteobacteria bacterium]